MGGQQEIQSILQMMALATSNFNWWGEGGGGGSDANDDITALHNTVDQEILVLKICLY